MAMSQEHGSTLQAVQQLMKKNQVRKSESLAPPVDTPPEFQLIIVHSQKDGQMLAHGMSPAR